MTSPVSAPDGFFVVEADRYVPTRHSRGYWMPGSLNGAAVASLLAAVLEQRHVEPGWIPVRFVVDLLGMARDEPLEVSTRVVKSGGRLRLVEGEIVQGGQLVARASLQSLRETEAPANPTWQSAPWSAPHPETVAAASWSPAFEIRPLPPEAARVTRAPLPPGDAAQSNMPVLGPLAPIANRQTWLTVRRTVIAGTPHTPFTRLATAADFASPFSHSSETGIDYVNTDFTIYLHRLPVGEWLGFEMVGHSARAGIGIGECWVHDEAGPLGTINVSALAQTRRG
ncbi:MAG: thioesterase family protein [Novosphingobium sp.]|uniref:thioesterase family protein n=1 Tax=Novosphingobium sp. TaxID=1874826 RepID=UPI003018DFC5